MAANWERTLEWWAKAGLIDAAVTERIRAFESERGEAAGMRWPVVLALALGATAIGAGVLLFVAAHWDDLSPSGRFSLALLLVALFHAAGAFLTERFKALSTALHGLGTVALGAGIFLAAQIFNLQEHWPGGIMLWALGAWIGWLALRDVVQASLAAILTPAWLVGEWFVATNNWVAGRIAWAGLLLLSVTYLTARTRDHDNATRRALATLGGLGVIPLTFFLAATEIFYRWSGEQISDRLLGLGAVAALGIPLAMAYLLRGRAALLNVVAALWVLGLALLPNPYSGTGSYFTGYVWANLGPYVLCGIGSIGLVAWGIYEARKERVNLGVAGFALTVLVFYFATIMDKLSRSVSLIGLGVLLLYGGWMVERVRRRLVARARGGNP